MMLTNEAFFSDLWEIERNLSKKQISLERALIKYKSREKNIEKNKDKVTNLINSIEDLQYDLNLARRNIESKTEFEKKKILEKILIDFRNIENIYNNVKNIIIEVMFFKR